MLKRVASMPTYILFLLDGFYLLAWLMLVALCDGAAHDVVH